MSISNARDISFLLFRLCRCLCRCHEYILLGGGVCIRANTLRCFCSLVVIILTTVFALFRLLVLIRSRVRFRFAREILKPIEVQKGRCQAQKIRERDTSRVAPWVPGTLALLLRCHLAHISENGRNSLRICTGARSLHLEMSAISDQLWAQFLINYGRDNVESRGPNPL